LKDFAGNIKKGDIVERFGLSHETLLHMYEVLIYLHLLNSYYGCGVFVGKLFCIMIALDYLFWVYLEWVLPRDEIEPAPKFPYKKFKKV
jgi:hypothetical protein